MKNEGIEKRPKTGDRRPEKKMKNEGIEKDRRPKLEILL
jgi:hypothetical protein